jgi:hypothetical protein
MAIVQQTEEIVDKRFCMVNEVQWKEGWSLLVNSSWLTLLEVGIAPCVDNGLW